VATYLKLIGANFSLTLSLQLNIFYANSDKLNNLHLFVVGTTSTAGRFVAPAILILQILIYSLHLVFGCYCERKITTKHQGVQCIFV